MKSGMRSTGLRAYATTAAARSLAYHGTAGCRTARSSAATSVLSARAFCFHRSKAFILERTIAMTGVHGDWSTAGWKGAPPPAPARGAGRGTRLKISTLGVTQVGAAHGKSVE